MDDVGLIVAGTLVSCVCITLVTGVYFHWGLVLLGLVGGLSVVAAIRNS